MNVLSAPMPLRAAADAPNPAPVEAKAPVEPKDSFLHNVGREARNNAVRWGNAAGMVIGGAGALTLTGGALYAGVLGGAVGGSAMGLGLGPVVASLGSHGAWNFLGNTFGAAGTAAKIGVILGGATMAAGAWDVGEALGNAVGKPVGALLGAPVGVAKGAWVSLEGGKAAPAPPRPAVEGEKPLDLNQLKGASKLSATFLGGAGMVTGGLGGAILGGSVASAGNLVSGLLAQNVSLAGLSGTAGVGAAVGGAVGALLGGRGGFRLAKGAQQAAHWIGDKWSQAHQEGSVDKASQRGLALIKAFDPITAGMGVADLSAGVAEALVQGDPQHVLGGVSAGLHGIVALGMVMDGADKSGPAQRTRMIMALGHMLLAVGHVGGAVGLGLYSLPIMAGGLLTVNAAP